MFSIKFKKTRICNLYLLKNNIYKTIIDVSIWTFVASLILWHRNLHYK